MVFRLTFLGTSSGIPTKYRNVSALAVQMVSSNAKNQPWLLIDCGEGTQQQLLKTTLSLKNLHAILISHVHGDHCYGLPGLLATLAMQGRGEPLCVIAPAAIAELLQAYEILTALQLPYVVDFIPIETLVQSNTPYTLSFGANHKLKLDVACLSHRVASYGFALTQHIEQFKLDTHKLKADGIIDKQWSSIKKAFDHAIPTLTIADQIIEPHHYVTSIDKQVKIIIAGDNDHPQLLAPMMDGVQALVHEATYDSTIKQKILARLDADAGFDPMHACAAEVAKFAAQVSVPALILTHFSARYALIDKPDDPVANMGHIRQEAEAYYDGKLILAEDFMCVEIDGHCTPCTKLNTPCQKML